MTIHPTAVVAQDATLGEGVALGPHAVVESGAVLDAGVVLGPNTLAGAGVRLCEGVVLGPGAVVTGRTVIGAGTRLSAGVVIGGEPQDLSFRDDPTECTIGARCTLREHVTVHRGTVRGSGRTVIGDDCYLMAGSHVGHDCVLGDGVMLSNAVLLAGHVQVGDFVLIGGGAAIVQRVRIGAFAFVSGLSGVTKDVVPYGYVIGHRGRLDSLNLVGLKRRGFDRAAIRRLLDAYAILFEEGPLFRDRLARLTAELGDDPAVRRIVEFIAAAPNRPLLQPLSKAGRDPAAETEFLETGR